MERKKKLIYFIFFLNINWFIRNYFGDENITEWVGVAANKTTMSPSGFAKDSGECQIRAAPQTSSSL